MNRFTVILKSGKEFTFDTLKAEDSVVDIIFGLGTFKEIGASKHKPLYVRANEVAAIYYETLDENDGGDTVT